MASDQAMRAVVERIETLVADLDGSPDPAVRRDAQELAHQLMRLYGAALSRMLRIVELHDGSTGRTTRALLDDDLVASLLVLHDLHPDGAETRIRRALERLQMSLGATLTLLELCDGMARVKVEDVHRATSTLELPGLIEGVIRAVAPDIVAIDITGVPAPNAAPLVQIDRKSATDRVTETGLR